MSNMTVHAQEKIQDEFKEKKLLSSYILPKKSFKQFKILFLMD